jgi:hypothetical protein
MLDDDKGHAVSFRNSSRASSPPAEAPMPTMGNAFCVLGSCGSGGMGAAGFFFRIFVPGGFFMVGILFRLIVAWHKPTSVRSLMSNRN